MISVWPFSFGGDIALVERQQVQDHRQMKRAKPMAEISLRQMRLLALLLSVHLQGTMRYTNMRQNCSKVTYILYI